MDQLIGTNDDMRGRAFHRHRTKTCTSSIRAQLHPSVWLGLVHLQQSPRLKVTCHSIVAAGFPCHSNVFLSLKHSGLGREKPNIYPPASSVFQSVLL